MDAETPVPQILALSALLPLGWAAAQDVATRTIPDRATLAVAALGLAARAGEGGSALAAAAMAATLVFAAGALLWWRGLLGGGDAKLLPAVALLLPPFAVPGLLLNVAMAGGVLALLYLLLAPWVAPVPAQPGGTLLRRVWAAEARRLRRRGPLPYGVAIALGTGLALSGQGA
ncbi:prepilin peptidase [Roseomonas sp. BN140053]|uniref:prepilin peptidase n=1 Tax=Roseomonas sp. BN140053 TaxID=3391898 RepID=UPI0039E7F65D